MNMSTNVSSQRVHSITHNSRAKGKSWINKLKVRTVLWSQKKWSEVELAITISLTMQNNQRWDENILVIVSVVAENTWRYSHISDFWFTSFQNLSISKCISRSILFLSVHISYLRLCGLWWWAVTVPSLFCLLSLHNNSEAARCPDYWSISLLRLWRDSQSRLEMSDME